MALVGTISGSNGTSNTAITGTLVIADTSISFPSIPGDATLYVQGTAIASGDLVSSGNLKSLNSTGDEGGEIFLKSPVTNTTITGGVTVDVYQNRLRFFEQGGTSRGYYIDITGGIAGASTNLAAAASPGGSSTYVQFNDGGTFGGSADFEFDKTSGIVTAATLVATGAGNSLVSSGSVLVKDSGGNTTVTLANSGDITGSNLRLTGDIAVVGGDLTTTATSFNLVTGASTIRMGANPSTVILSGTIDASGSAATALFKAVGGDISVASSTGKLLLGPAGQNQQTHNNSNYEMTNTTGHILLTNNALNQRIELSTTGSTSAGMFRIRRYTGTTPIRTVTDLLEVRNDGTVLIGSASTGATFLGSTTISNDLFLSSGRIAVNTDTTAIELVSSGNVTVKLDANNNAAGHFFAVQNFAGTNQLLVNENGNVDVSGSLVVSGSVLATVTTTTFNLLNTTLTGTLNIGGATQIVNIGGITSTGSFPGELRSDGNFNVGLVSERLFNSSSAGGTMSFNVGAQTIFYVNNPTSDITANFTSVPVTNLRVITPTVILSQSATPRNVTAVQIDGVGQPINWAGGSSPTVTANRQEVFGFSLIRSGSAWKVLGQMTSYG